MLQNCGLEKKECLIIEDSLIGVQAANSADIDVAVIYDKYSDSDREKINQLATYQFKTYQDAIDLFMEYAI